MAGKITFKHGTHSSREGGIVEPIHIEPKYLVQLALVLERNLTQDEVNRISGALENFRHIKQIDIKDRAANQDIKRTLGKISKLSPEKAVEALADCDEFTRAEIESALYCKDGLLPRGSTQRLTPELIPRAAELALDRVNARGNVGGRPEKIYQKLIAEFSWNMWRELGQTDTKVWHTGELGNRSGDFKSYRSPLMEWTSVLFQIVDGVSDDSQVKKLLTEVIKREG
jgi:hypothetical protein